MTLGSVVLLPTVLEPTEDGVRALADGAVEDPMALVLREAIMRFRHMPGETTVFAKPPATWALAAGGVSPADGHSAVQCAAA